MNKDGCNTGDVPVSKEAVMQHIASHRSTSFDDPLWTKMPPMYKQLLYVMLSGGVKSSSHGTYMRNFLEFWRTMRRLRIRDELIFRFPIADAVLQMYVIDCAMVRPKKNVYGTIRGKLRAIDYVVQLAGKRQAWCENPALYTIMQYVKRRNPNLGSDTLPVSGKMMLEVISFIMVSKVYHDLELSEMEQGMARRWISFEKVWRDKIRLHWYVYAVSILTLGCLGLRGAECFENSAAVYEGYGLFVSDITVICKNPFTNRMYESSEYVSDTDKIHHICFKLRNSKTASVGRNTYLRMGRTHRRIDPAVLINHLLMVQRDVMRNTEANTFLFSVPGCNMTLRNVKKKWTKIIVEEMQFSEGKRYRLHGTRKGFATTLLKNGVAMSLIAFAGQWKLHAAIYKYLIHTQSDLLVIVTQYLYGVCVNGKSYDFDESEHRIVGGLRANRQVLTPEMFSNTQALGHRNL